MQRILIRIKNAESQAITTKRTLEFRGFKVIRTYPFDVIVGEVPEENVHIIKSLRSLRFCEKIAPYHYEEETHIKTEDLMKISEQEVIAHKVFGML